MANERADRRAVHVRMDLALYKRLRYLAVDYDLSATDTIEALLDWAVSEYYARKDPSLIAKLEEGDD